MGSSSAATGACATTSTAREITNKESLRQNILATRLLSQISHIKLITLNMDPLGVPIFLKLLEIPNLCPTQLSPQWPSPAMASLATSRAWVFSRVRFIVAGLSTGSTLPSTRIIPLSTSRPGFRVR